MIHIYYYLLLLPNAASCTEHVIKISWIFQQSHHLQLLIRQSLRQLEGPHQPKPIDCAAHISEGLQEGYDRWNNQVSIHLLSSVVVQTHNLLIASHLPYLVDHGSTQLTVHNTSFEGYRCGMSFETINITLHYIHLVLCACRGSNPQPLGHFCLIK